ncbi:MAG: DUF6340 family protein [Candidatus Cryptobacteroides sp.]
MKFNPLFSALLGLAMVSCGPSRYVIDLEMRYPSKAGIDLAGKNVSVVYLEDGRDANTSFCSGMADGFADAIQKDYSMPEGSVGVYRMPVEPGASYGSRDTLVNLLMDTGADVVFLFDTVKLGTMTIGAPAKVASGASRDSSYLSSCNIPFTMKMYCYDAMNKEDKVKSFTGSSVLCTDVYSDGSASRDVMRSRACAALPSEGYASGQTISTSFISQWKVEQYSILYFDSTLWYSAIEKVENFDWTAAMDIWMGFLESSDPLKRSSASYNIATACHILGNDALAGEWLDRSDADNPLPVTETLRKRIAARL